ncbi:uncharacterized protein LOC119099004 [Pollicipes pollicipes]|uniref:uncharacterized protein LOC119099004 n=1 Tax=Pollicipes pollicipes TaxID=41117 RepID=UPI0018857110|nr:uncharacterized protein LOC119099004 [Pollicipes pollicipes]
MPGSRSPPSLLQLLLLLAALLQPVLSAAAQAPADPGEDADDACIPAIANGCFDEVVKDLACQNIPQAARPATCSDRDALDTCFALDDALNCTSDIIDGDCSAADGRLVYDGWLSGLRAVQRHLCADGAANMLEFFRRTSCWNPLTYLQCLERSANITHVTDLLKVKLDPAECRRTLQAASACSADQASRCAGVPGRLDQALTAFLLESPCGSSALYVPPAPAAAATVTGAALAITVLALATVLLGVALGLLAYRTACFRIPLAGR